LPIYPVRSSLALKIVFIFSCEKDVVLKGIFLGDAGGGLFLAKYALLPASPRRILLVWNRCLRRESCLKKNEGCVVEEEQS
jgi:hypothetical protein